MRHDDDALCRWLKGRLTQKRYKHSLAVQKRAGYLAKLHGDNEDKAMLAGLLHDCCHCMAFDEQLKIIKSRGILLDDFTAAQPRLWHAIAGSVVIRDELQIYDDDVISAVLLHTAGGKDMSRLAQVVYLADLTSSDRDYAGVDEDRRLSEKSLERAMLKHLGFTIKSIVKAHTPIVQNAWEAYNYFWKYENKVEE